MTGQRTTGKSHCLHGHQYTLWSVFRRVIKELKAAEAQKPRSGSVSSFSNLSTHSSNDSAGKTVSNFSYEKYFYFSNFNRLKIKLFSKVMNILSAKSKGGRKYGTSRRPLILQGQEKSKPTERAPPPKKELQKTAPKLAKEFIDSRWPKVKID